MGQTSSAILFHLHPDQKDAQRLLDEAEQKDFYVEECREDPSNASARKGLHYRAKGMTPREYKFFEVVIENAKGRIPPRLQRELKEVHVIQLDPSAEGGMPHTRPNALICYPDIGTTFSTTTLLHELWHLHQRKQVEWWNGVFQRLGWEPWHGTLPPALENHRRYNPDTIEQPLWCYRKTWVPVPIFQDISRPRVTEVTIWFYHVSLHHHVKQIPREIQEEYHSLPLSAHEHPREMAAYLLSDPIRYAACPAMKSMMEAVGWDSFLLNGTE